MGWPSWNNIHFGFEKPDKLTVSDYKIVVGIISLVISYYQEKLSFQLKAEVDKLVYAVILGLTCDQDWFNVCP